MFLWRLCVVGRKRDHAPKVVPGHMSRWQQMVQTLTRLEDSIKKFGTLKVSSDLQAS